VGKFSEGARLKGWRWVKEKIKRIKETIYATGNDCSKYINVFRALVESLL
jgi:hypothetical protein